MQASRPGSRGQKYALASDEDSADFWGFAQDADGLFTPPPDDGGVRRVRLAGCRPEGGLAVCAGQAGRRRAAAGNAWLELLDGDGVPMGAYFVDGVTVTGVEPSARGGGLVDLMVALGCAGALPGAERTWELIRSGRLDRPGMWHGLTAEDRHAWLSVALYSREYRRRGKPDAPAGAEFTVDGRHTLDRDTFYCALGEAVNGPGGYFGWNLDALDDCLRGGWGATAPFTLRWTGSAEARSRARSAEVFDPLLEIFAERGVHVVLE